jgi:hypothetical protein
MDAAGAAGQQGGPGTPDGDLARHVSLRTTDVDEARAFCRAMFYGPLEVRPVGGTAGWSGSCWSASSTRPLDRHAGSPLPSGCRR